jgi:hypothetical protein
LGGGWQTRIGQDYVKPEMQQVMAERTDWGGILDEPKNTTAETPVEAGWRSPDW